MMTFGHSRCRPRLTLAAAASIVAGAAAQAQTRFDSDPGWEAQVLQTLRDATPEGYPIWTLPVVGFLVLALLARLLFRRRPEPAGPQPGPRRASGRRPAARRPAQSDGMIFQRDLGQPASLRRAAPEGAAPDPRRSAPARTAAHAPERAASTSAPDDDGAELLDYFEERFSLPERSAAAAIDYMNRLAGAIDRLRGRAEAAETRADALDDALRRGAGGGEGGSASDPVAAAWRIAIDGARSIRIAAQALRDAPDFRSFAALVGIEEAVRRLITEQARQRGGAVDPRIVEEDWPHALWRAEALLSAYFPTGGDWGDLRHGVSVAAAALRQMLLLEGVAVGHVRLLAPFDRRDGEAWSDSSDGLRDVGPIRERARWMARVAAAQEAVGDDPTEAPLVIDCEAFGFADERRGLSAQARLITFDRAAWT